MTTPLIEQYLHLKEQYKDCILFFRVGDFYEMFFDDAKISASELNITLTKHGKKHPMCGIPFHASDSYINRLVNAGHNVALCEQTETPDTKVGKKGPLKRDVVRVITPGTITETSMLDPKSHNFLLACSPVSNEQIGFAVVDLSTGDFFVEDVFKKDFSSIISKWNPKELIIPQSFLSDEDSWMQVLEWQDKARIIPDLKYNLQECQENLKKLYKIHTLDSFGFMSNNSVIAAGSIARHIFYTQKSNSLSLKSISKLNNSNFMMLDQFTRNNLEIVKTIQGEKKGSLVNTLDKTLTSSGARLLQMRLSSPSKEEKTIRNRIESVDFFVKFSNRSAVSDLLRNYGDIERSSGRLFLKRGGPRDLLEIANSLQSAAMIYQILKNEDLSDELKREVSELKDLDKIYPIIYSAIDSEPPLKISDGGFIKKGYSEQLDSIRGLEQKALCDIEMLEESYKQATEINTLKVRKNSSIGFCIEVPASQSSKVPYSYIKKQTLTNIIRYVTPEIQDLNERMVSSTLLALSEEIKIFQDICDHIKKYRNRISLAAKAISVIDVSLGLADYSLQYDYCKPLIAQGKKFNISKGRNPVIENILMKSNEDFTANDCDFDKNKFMLMTGPNMAGKSTFLRQNALIVLMAQAGCFVPAESAELGIFDGIFVRIGASDNLGKGMSTFMTEMVETAIILNSSTENSFVVVDEIGRGTSVEEGEAIAFSVMKSLSEKRCCTLFATHYHSLADISANDSNIDCYTMEVQSWGEKLIFKHKLVKGASDSSYALYVCGMAGIPSSVIEDAKRFIVDRDKTQTSS
ncbi:DNA mismatch repair protein MutS [Candidatus Nesciobacter abundans]|uniref:DNA mismatch repair protein MutS n=1 Tax=Candidatus Nesciobacter abundans TaxID=2601668 RepID=A0A5C0UHT7_9PROT|nr:DNA mismatch repair protein MutS [Candidatus Nesciobacter abundans]QEK39290.1 DNA mismatch repair protein MutS [Candidatus Nesciobacter abundans]